MQIDFNTALLIAAVAGIVSISQRVSTLEANVKLLLQNKTLKEEA